MATTPLTISIDTSEIDSYVAKFPFEGARIAEDGLDAALDDSLGFIELQVIDFATDVNNTGRFLGSIFNENRGTKVDLLRGIDLEGFVSSNDEEPKVNAIEFGRSAGKMPPIEKILLWVRQRKLAGIFSVKTRRRKGSKAKKEKEDIAAAWGVAKHIAAHGTEARRVFARAFEASEEYVNNAFDDALDQIINDWEKIE